MKAASPRRAIMTLSFDLPVQQPFPCRSPRLASAAAMDLADVPNDAMLREMQRRLDCMTRPEKRVILVGALLRLCNAARPAPLVVLLSLERGVACCRSRLAPRVQAHRGVARGRSRRRSRHAVPERACRCDRARTCMRASR